MQIRNISSTLIVIFGLFMSLGLNQSTNDIAQNAIIENEKQKEFSNPNNVPIPDDAEAPPYIAPPTQNTNANDWIPAPDSDHFENPEFSETQYKAKPGKKNILEDYGTTDAELPFWSAEDEENHAIIASTIHRKREIDPVKRNDLMEISKILGALHALRITCSGEGDQTYRSRMNSLLDMEAPSAQYIRDPLILSFNSGFQSQGAGNASCPKNREIIEANLAKNGRLISLKMAKFYEELNEKRNSN